MHIGKNMKRLVSESGFTQQEVADRMGINRQTLIYYFSQPTQPSPIKLQAFCDAVRCTIDDVIGERDTTYKIPIYGTIACGIPMSAITDISGYEEVSRDVYRDVREYFALRMKGMSMYPRIKTGDVVIFHKQETADNGDIVAVFVGGEDATCKQMILQDDGIVLHPLNECYGDMVFSYEQIKTLPIEIIGKAVELRAKL